MSKHLLLVILALAAFGCAGLAPQSSGNQSCWTSGGKLYCSGAINYSWSGDMNSSAPVPDAGLDMPECQRLYLRDGMSNVYTVRRLDGTVYGVFVDKKSSPLFQVANYTPESVLANPCAYRDAFSQGSLAKSFCFYNSSTASISCWDNVTFVEGPQSVNGTEATADGLNLSGTGSVIGIRHGPDVFFASLCNRNYSQIFQLGFEGDVRAVDLRINGKNFCADPKGAIAGIWNASGQE